ncbi:13832_t:CDS:1, partial [Acaulospora morrowiae]
TSSSSSTSLSPSVLPTHTGSPRLYKKTSNSQLTPQRRSNSRQKAQAQIPPINTLSAIEDNQSIASSISDSPIERPSSSAEPDEAKTTVTINVVDPRTEQVINGDVPRENNFQIENISDSHLDANDSQSGIHKFSPEHAQEHIESWNRNSVSNGDENNRRIALDMMTSPSISSTHDASPILHKKNSNTRLKEHRRQNSRQKDQTVFVDQESDEGYQSDRNVNRRNSLETPVIEKNFQDSTQEDETFIKPGHRRRRRRTRSSKNNNQQNSREQQRPEQKSSKHEQTPKHELVQHKVNELTRSRKSSDSIRSMSFAPLQKQLHVQNPAQQQQPNELNKSLQIGDSTKTNWPKSTNQNIDALQFQSQQRPHQRSDQSTYFPSVNKRNNVPIYQQPSNATTIPAKAELNKNTTIFRRSEILASPHTEISTQNTHLIDQSNTDTPMTKFTSYADVISPHNRNSSVTTRIPQTMNSLLSNEVKITTPAPTASVMNVTNRQWYSPFGSGLSIQFTPPTSPKNSHSKLPSSKNSSLTFASTSNSSSTIPERHQSVISPPPPISAANNASSSMSMFTSSPFSTLNTSSSNLNQLNSMNALSASSSLRGTFFGKKHPILDKEKGD